jgi:hypothetical protein
LFLLHWYVVLNLFLLYTTTLPHHHLPLATPFETWTWRQGSSKDALSLFKEMKASSIQPSVITYVFLSLSLFFLQNIYTCTYIYIYVYIYIYIYIYNVCIWIHIYI